MGGAEKRLARGSCSGIYRRIAGLNLDAARRMASELAAFAKEHGAKVLVIENLKGWRQKAPSRAMRRKFHRFQPHMLVKYLSGKAEEYGICMLEVDPRGTSRWVYPGVPYPEIGCSAGMFT
jgi:IS605 OrfB family transposase